MKVTIELHYRNDRIKSFFEAGALTTLTTSPAATVYCKYYYGICSKIHYFM